MTHFQNVTSFEDLKNQFRALARTNHPDAGGDPEIMKQINAEYDKLFPIWKDRYNATAENPIHETAESTRSEFYTQCGWKGAKNDRSRSTKEVTALVRDWIKKAYPTCKFSVRFSSASMCSEIHISLKEAPWRIYKTWDELTHEEIKEIWLKAIRQDYMTFGTLDEETEELLRHMYEEGGDRGNFYSIKTEVAKAMFDAVDAEVNSYNYSDCDGMIDYFDVDFYYFGCQVDYDFKIVPKTPRLSRKVSGVQTTEPATGEAKELPEASGEYEIVEDVHTKTGEKIFVVKIVRKLSREEYLQEKEKMTALGGYYSKFKHGFIFRDDPRERLAS